MRFVCFALTVWASTSLAVERVALIVGANRGAPHRAQLWFAERDAERLARTLIELGDFAPNHVTVLKQPSAEALRATLHQAELRLSQARAEGQRTIFVVYFSGHAGTGALELGDERFDFSELKTRMESSSADVKVAIVDACESGVLTQVKGARALPSIDFALPTEETAHGIAYIASTAVGEAAQESAAIGGSFFTFHLDTALRGAGDANGDGLVSLAEAFQYTSNRTISGTSTTAAGPQHPTYDFRMAGRGDMTLSDLRKAEATLVLGGDSSSTWLVKQNRQLVAEAAGGQGLALPSGMYRIERRHGSSVFAGDINLPRGQRLAVGDLPQVTALAAREKGGTESSTALVGGVTAGLAALAGANASFGGRIGVRHGWGSWGLRGLAGFEGGSGALASGPYSTQTVSADVAVMRRWALSSVIFDLGPEFGIQWTWQQLANGTTVNGSSATLAGSAALGVRIGAVTPLLTAWGGGRLMRIDNELRLRPVAGGALLLGVDL